VHIRPEWLDLGDGIKITTCWCKTQSQKDYEQKNLNRVVQKLDD
jgi:hypothetical protein